MCTVTYLPAKDSCYLVSNRDERHFRQKAFPPALNKLDDNILLYPTDADAGGTWIAVSGNGHAAVLLNGAFEKHISSPPYRKSRGLVFLEIIQAALPVSFFSSINLRGIEPFTLIILSEELQECRWDGQNKFIRRLHKQQPYIWSSVTLYDEITRQEREKWFNDFLEQHSQPSMDELLAFHHFAGDGDQHKDLRMNRNNEVFTVSITGMHIRDRECSMHYFDLSADKVYEKTIDFHTSPINS